MCHVCAFLQGRGLWLELGTQSKCLCVYLFFNTFTDVTLILFLSLSFPLSLFLPFSLPPCLSCVLYQHTHTHTHTHAGGQYIWQNKWLSGTEYWFSSIGSSRACSDVTLRVCRHIGTSSCFACWKSSCLHDSYMYLDVTYNLVFKLLRGDWELIASLMCEVPFAKKTLTKFEYSCTRHVTIYRGWPGVRLMSQCKKEKQKEHVCRKPTSSVSKWIPMYVEINFHANIL
jgi:hypothetical protein